MALGPGRYADIAEEVRERVGLHNDTFVPYRGGVILLVLGGNRGAGFEVQADPKTAAQLPALLREMADQIESGAQ